MKRTSRAVTEKQLAFGKFERKHVHHLKKYGELTENTLKRKHDPKTPSTIKQSTLLKTVSQKSIDKSCGEGCGPRAPTMRCCRTRTVQRVCPGSAA
ncbi:hypothetical protein J4Q44_G00299710 [Coregonus suidteri]|uniref:Uncharacterized protein n=1 Tax=Coregonus suidteri TaxID=861788 RepID=A0AAN8KXT8_9TELE